MKPARTDHHALAESLIGQMPVDDRPDVRPALFDEIARIPHGIKSAILFDQFVRDYRDVLPNIDVPALVCLGEDGTLLETAGVEYVAEHTSDGSFDIGRVFIITCDNARV